MCEVPGYYEFRIVSTDKEGSLSVEYPTYFMKDYKEIREFIRQKETSLGETGEVNIKITYKLRY